MPIQLSHTETTNKTHNKEIVVIADEIRSPENVGMILRVTEAFGCKEVYFIGDSPTLDSNRVKRASRSSEKELKLHFNQESKSTIYNLKNIGFKVFALEITKNSQLIQKVDFTSQEKIAVFIGNERKGISEDILSTIENHLYFDMFGKNSSLNVVNALAIALYEITRQY